MTKLTTARRKRIPKSQYGLPSKKKKGGAGQGGYPMPDKSHAQNAKARAQQMYDKGKLSLAEKKRIDTKANRILKAKGAKTIAGKKVKAGVKK